MALKKIVKSGSNTTKAMLPSAKQKEASSTSQECWHPVMEWLLILHSSGSNRLSRETSVRLPVRILCLLWVGHQEAYEHKWGKSLNFCAYVFVEPVKGMRRARVLHLETGVCSSRNRNDKNKISCEVFYLSGICWHSWGRCQPVHRCELGFCTARQLAVRSSSGCHPVVLLAPHQSAGADLVTAHGDKVQA